MLPKLCARTSGGRVVTARFALEGGRSRVGVISVDNEAKRNALCGRGMTDLREGVEMLRADPKVAAVLLCGARGRFCAGAEMPTLLDGGFQRHMHDTLGLMRSAGFVSYALIEHHAMGGGAELAMSCDVRLWGPHASMQFVQTGKGITTGWGGAAYLEAALSRAAATHLLCSGEAIRSFEGAVRYGVAQAEAPQSGGGVDVDDLVHVAGDEDACQAATTELLSPAALSSLCTLLTQYKANFPSAVRASKRTLNSSTPLLTEELEFNALWGNADQKEALKTWSIMNKTA